MTRLQGKRALITGGTTGIGLETAREFIDRPGILGLVKAGRFGEPSEIAKAVVYLASDETRFAVGSELNVDGGLSL